jgi:hypothetical protein
MPEAKRAPIFKEPYPGLRAFEANEALLFMGVHGIRTIC